MKLCERHRIATMTPARKNSKAAVAKYVAGDPNSCPYCLMWTDKKRKKK